MLKRHWMTTAALAANTGRAAAKAPPKEEPKAETAAAEPKASAEPIAPTAEGSNAGQEVAERTTGTGVAVYSDDDAGAGLEGVTADEMTIPFVKVVQSNSRIMKESEPQFYNPLAKAGMLYKHTTLDLFDGRDKGLIMIPCYREHYYTEATPFDKGGGFHGIRQPEDPLVKQLRQAHGKFGKLPVPGTEHELAEVFNVFAIFITPDDYVFRAILPFGSTQIPKYKTFLEISNGFTFINAKGEPRPHALYAHLWHLTTAPEKTKKGDIMGLKLRLANGATPIDPKPARLAPDDARYLAGRQFHDMIKAGNAKVDYAEATAGPGGGAEDEEIPF